MKKLSLGALLSLMTLFCVAQKEYIIHGKVELLTGSKTIRLSGHEDVTIRPDGSFDIKGDLGGPGVSLIGTDSSGMNLLWLEAGEYEIHCKEMRLSGVASPVFRIDRIKGPVNAELCNDFCNQEYNGFGVKAREGEDKRNVHERQKARAIRYLDSVFVAHSHSPVLPFMVRSEFFLIGDNATRAFIQRLPADLKNNGEINMLEKAFDLRDKIRKEKVFENFTLTDTSGNKFTLASLSGKKAILLDLWASGCGPCRIEHPRLRDWYQKYADKGFDIVSISIDMDKGEWLKAVKKDGIGSWVNVCDTLGFKAALMKNYYVPYIPFRFLLDSGLNIVGVDNKLDSWIAEKDITALLDK